MPHLSSCRGEDFDEISHTSTARRSQLDDHPSINNETCPTQHRSPRQSYPPSPPRSQQPIPSSHPTARLHKWRRQQMPEPPQLNQPRTQAPLTRRTESHKLASSVTWRITSMSNRSDVYTVDTIILEWYLPDVTDVIACVSPSVLHVYPDARSSSNTNRHADTPKSTTVFWSLCHPLSGVTSPWGVLSIEDICF